MNFLAAFLVIVGVFLPTAFGRCGECPGKGDEAVDLTKGDQTWYYCQTSLAGRTSTNCYVTLKPKEEGSTEAVIHSYDITSEKEDTDTMTLQHIHNGKYDYVDRGTKGMIMNATSDKNCAAYWKCHDDASIWNGVKGSGAYFMFFCTDPELCKAQKDYNGDYRKIFDEVKNKTNVEIFDLSQEKCKTLNIVPQK